MERRAVRRCFGLVILWSALVLAVQPVGAETALKKTAIVIGSPGFIYTLHYVAEGAGFFKAEGLDIDTVQVPSGPRQVAAVMGGSAVVAPTNIEHVVRSFAQGGNMVAISRIFDVSPYVLVLSNKAIAKAGITDGMSIDDKVKRLHGMKIGVTTAGSGTDSFLRSLLLARGGVPDKELAIEPMGNPDGMLTALEHDIIDGFVFLAPDSEIPAQKGYGKVVIDPITGDVPELRNVPYMVVTTSRDTLAKDGPQIASIVRAYARAMKLVKDDPKAARGYVRRYLKEADENVFNAAFDKYIAALPSDPIITPDQVSNMVRWMNISAPAPIAVTYDDIVSSDMAKAVAKDLPTN
jgi:NitT/TauT family transport system substrate-binding protein